MNDEKVEIYKPTLAEIYYWMAYADPYTKPTRADVAKRAVELMKENGVIEKDIPDSESIRKMTYEWENKVGYKEWVKEYWGKLMEESKPLLDKIGLQRGVKDFRYWEAMQMKYANYKRKSDVTTDDKPINNTDQIANLLMEALKDGGEAEGNKDTKEDGGNSEVESSKGEATENPNI